MDVFKHGPPIKISDFLQEYRNRNKSPELLVSNRYGGELEFWRRGFFDRVRA